MLCYAMLCYAMLCYAMLCYAMPCHAILCYARRGPRTICDMFLTNSHAYNLRHKDFYQPSFNTVTHGKHSIRYLGPRLWSKINQARKDRLPVLNSLRPGYAVLI